MTAVAVGPGLFIPDVQAIQSRLPVWAVADVAMRAVRGPNADSPWLVIDCDSDQMYPAWLGELRRHYAETMPPRAWFEPGTMDLKPEWGACLNELAQTPVTAYWLEVAYQCAKMDLQVAVHRLQFEIRMHGGREKYAQRTAPQGRPTAYAAGAYTGAGEQQLRGKEAREHYKRLRGFAPG